MLLLLYFFSVSCAKLFGTFLAAQRTVVACEKAVTVGAFIEIGAVQLLGAV
jgi:hypothetical protein